MPDMQTSRKALWGWALNDWANSAFATTVMAGFFPLFFKAYWAGGSTSGEGTFALGLANSAASLAVAVLAPILGAIADRGSLKKRLLAFFTFVGALNTAALFFVAQGQWGPAVVLYIAASVGFFGSLSFYDSLLVSVAPRDRWDQASSLGFALGYLGGGLLFLVNILMYSQPGWFGLASPADAVKASFATVGLWWLLFSVPLLLWVREPRDGGGLPLGRAVKAGLSQLGETLVHLRSRKTIVLFLAAYFFYIDGVDTIIKMAVSYGTDLGFSGTDLMLALLLVQFLGFPAALFYGWLSTKLGIRRAILLGVAGYMAITVFGYFMTTVAHFYLLAAAVALFQGGLQALSRSFFARLVPAEKSGEYFGFFNMFGKFSTIIGPVLMGFTTLISGDPRIGILSVLLLFVAGGGLFWFVKVPRA